VSGWAPRAPEDIVRPRRQAGLVARPLNFTVRRLVSLALLSSLTLGLVAALVLTLMYGTLASKGKLVVHLAVAFAVPLLALWLFVINAYRLSNWAPFGLGSSVPHVLAALAFLALLIWALLRVSGSLATKVLVGALVCGIWAVVWLFGSLMVACAMGDCL